MIEPDVERREIDTAKIDTEDFEVGVFAGQMSVEDFGVNTVAGARFAYHITEGFVVELAAGQTDTEQTSFERLSGAAQLLLTDSEREYTYYNLSLGYNIFPGESFIGKSRALNTSLYVIGGVGKTTFAGDERFTVNLGLGMRGLCRWTGWPCTPHPPSCVRHRLVGSREDGPQPRGASRVVTFFFERWRYTEVVNVALALGGSGWAVW